MIFRQKRYLAFLLTGFKTLPIFETIRNLIGIAPLNTPSQTNL